MPKHSNRRRSYFIDKRLQGVWAMLNLVIAATVGLLITLEILRSFYVEFGWPLAGKPFNLPDLLFIVKLTMLALIGGVFIWLLSAFAGHRIAGPIYKLDQCLKEVEKGNYSLRVQFRKKDFFQEIADSFNEMNASIETKFKTNTELLEKIKDRVNALPQDNPNVRDIKQLLGAS